MGRSSFDCEHIRTNIGKMLAQSSQLHLFASDTNPDSLLGKIESNAQTQDEYDGRWPDKQRARIFGYQ
jgi:hypothetical protein